MLNYLSVNKLADRSLNEDNSLCSIICTPLHACLNFNSQTKNECAKNTYNFEMFRRQNQLTFNEPLNSSRIMQYLGCDVNQQNAKGYTPLHRAASKGNLTIISCLLHNGQYQHSIKKQSHKLGQTSNFFFSFLSIVIIVKISFPTKEDLEIYQNRMFIFLSVHLSMASDYNFWYSLIFIRLNIRCSYLTQRLQMCH